MYAYAEASGLGRNGELVHYITAEEVFHGQVAKRIPNNSVCANLISIRDFAQASFLGRAGGLGGAKVQRAGGDGTNCGGRCFIFGGRDDSNPATMPATEARSRAQLGTTRPYCPQKRLVARLSRLSITGRDSSLEK